MTELVLTLKSPLPEGSPQEERWESGREPIIIGRSEECTIRIKDVKVSRQHCRIEPAPEGGYKLIDLGSANGTFVNGNRVTEVLLAGGETITIGGYKIEVEPLTKPTLVSSGTTVPDEHPSPKEVARLRSEPSTKKVLPTVIALTITGLVVIVFIVILSHQARKGPKKLSSESTEVESRAVQKPQVESTPISEAERQRQIAEAIKAVEEKRERELSEKERARLERERRRQEAEAKRQQQLEEARRRREEERQRQAEEARRQQEEEQKYLAQDKERFNQFLPAYKESIKDYQFSEAVKLCEDFLKDSKTQSIREEVTVLLEEAQRQDKIFSYLIEKLTEEPRRFILGLEKMKIKIDKANKTSLEGPLAEQEDTWYTRRWEDLKPEDIYDLFRQVFSVAQLTDENRLSLAIFCYEHNLIPQADTHLVRYYKRHPEDKETINNLISRKKNIPIPEGGFIVYQGRLVTPEEKSYLAKGYVKHNGKWITQDELMTAKGYVKVDDVWVTKERAEHLKERQAAREQQAREAKICGFKGDARQMAGLARVNEHRKAAGLNPVVLDEDLCRACQLHAEYLQKNGGIWDKGLDAHNENPNLPGYTPEGAKAGQLGVICTSPDPAMSVDFWMGSFYHRICIIHPDLEKIGIGTTSKGGTTMDARQGVVRDSDTRRGKEKQWGLVRYPAKGQRNVPRQFFMEMPNPLPKGVNPQTVGYPVTLTFFKGGSLTKVQAKLLIGSHTEVPCYFSCPEQPAAGGSLFQQNTICLIPKEHLQGSTTYHAEITGRIKGQDFEEKWSFTTQ